LKTASSNVAVAVGWLDGTTFLLDMLLVDGSSIGRCFVAGDVTWRCSFRSKHGSLTMKWEFPASIGAGSSIDESVFLHGLFGMRYNTVSILRSGWRGYFGNTNTWCHFLLITEVHGWCIMSGDSNPMSNDFKWAILHGFHERSLKILLLKICKKN
jgi:hypothetical protein